MKDQFKGTLHRLGRAFGRAQESDAAAAEPAVPDAPEAADRTGTGTSGAAAPTPAPAAQRTPTLVRSPLDGEVIELADVPDPAFAKGMVGPGLAIRPTSTTVHSPVAGEVILVFATKHAVAVRAPSGVEVLVHVGIDTVTLKGRGFESHVTRGDVVEVGAPLISFDPAVVEAAGYDLTTPVVITNFRSFPELRVLASPSVTTGSGLFTVL